MQSRKLLAATWSKTASAALRGADGNSWVGAVAPIRAANGDAVMEVKARPTPHPTSIPIQKDTWSS